MRIRHLIAIPALVLLASCYQFEITAQAGFSELALDGEIGYLDDPGNTNPIAIQQDIESALGLGDDQGTPYARVAMDFGTPVLAVSGFLFEDDGSGVLDATFGTIPVGAGVLTDFELGSAKVSYSFEIPIGPVSVAPGLAVNFVDLSLFARDTIGFATADVELQAPLPMGFVRGEVDIVGWLQLVGEVGYIEVDVDDVEAEMLDIEALVELTGFEPLNIFVGYRSIDLVGEGEIDNDSIDIDIGLSGFIVGGGVRF